MESAALPGDRPAEVDDRLVHEAAARLVETVRGYGAVAVAFSGGVDSTVVAKAALLALGDRAIAITGTSESLAQGELDQARELARQIGIRHEVVTTSEMANPAYQANDGTRCYHCKSSLYDHLTSLRDRFGFDVLCSGANLDDLGDYRPGLVAAAERGVRHPLQDAGFTKDVTRKVAAFWRLSNHDKPATPCLASRLAIGVSVTPERLGRIDEAERWLRERGFVPVRVRYHEGDLARIEVAANQLERWASAELREAVARRLKELGFRFISLDIEGFRSGSLNVLVPLESRLAGTTDDLTHRVRPK